MSLILPRCSPVCKAVILDELFLKEIECRYCGQSFFLCQSCWRMQTYCSDICRTIGYRQKKRQRQRKYRKTPKGRRTHSNNENKRRNIQRKKNIKKKGDGTSNPYEHALSSHPNNSFKTSCCHFCGEKGVLVDQFPRRRYGSSRLLVFNHHFSRKGGYHVPRNQ